ncbi:hypothetical protein SVIOM342S_06722 [Streptomyces violaceorubidus]
MTTVMRPADAPRAASHIRSSSTRCSWTGLTSGWTRNTSRSRQLAISCTSRQSLANRLTRVGLSRHAQLGADLLGQVGVGTTAEHGDVSHGPLLGCSCPAGIPELTEILLRRSRGPGP